MTNHLWFNELMTEERTIGSLCTGYGALDTAVHTVLGARTAWVSDIDPGACRIINHRMPGIPNLGDLTTVDWTQVEPVDILTAGYPCQPFSVAGKRKGTADDRHIWPHIADALRVLRPRIALFENVAGHLRLGFDTVLADLAALGFDAQWCTVRASDVGAPHRRERLFILAVAADTDRDTVRQQPVGLARCGRTAVPGLTGPEPAARGGAPDWGRFAAAIARWEHSTGRRAPWATDDRNRLSPAFVEWMMGLPAGHVTDVPGLTRTQQLKALGNGVVPQQAELALWSLLTRTR